MRLTLAAALLLSGCFQPVCESWFGECQGLEPPLIAAPDSGAPDGGADAGLPIDAGTEFCAGDSARVQRGQTLKPVVVTGSPVFMGCCDGAEFLLHTEAALGGQTRLFLAIPGGRFPLETFAIGDDPQQRLSATLDIGATHYGSGASAAAPRFSGTVTLSRAVPEASNPLLARLCLAVKAAGDPFDGVRFYAPAARVLAGNWSQRFALHLLENRKLDAIAAAQLPLASLVLNPEPILDLHRLRYYQATDGFLAFTADTSGEALKNRLGTVPVSGTPFVVVADGERIYLGAFWTALSSNTPRMPFIRIEEMSAKGATLAPPRGTTADPRSDPRVFKALDEAGKLVP